VVYRAKETTVYRRICFIALAWFATIAPGLAQTEDPGTIDSTTTASTLTTCPWRGSCDLEPGLAGRTDLLLFEDWEAGDWSAHWTSVDFPENTSAGTVPAPFAGVRSGEVRVPNHDHDGVSLNFDFAEAGLPEPEEIYFRYYIRFNDTWQRNGDGEIGKLPGFAGTYGVGGWGARRSDGTNGWSARMVGYDTGATNQVGFYTYHADMLGDYGEHMLWPRQLERHRWYCLEARVRMNSISGASGSNDGILEGWIDDEPVFSRQNLRFRDVDRILIESIWGNVYVGGSWSADRDMAIHFDNAVIARNRIGCAATTPPPPPDATPPTVSLTTPVAGATLSGITTVSASAADDVAVVGVRFTLDGVNLGAEDTTAPYAISWNTLSAPNGSHTLTAVARDAAGNLGSATVTVTVANDTTAPVVSGVLASSITPKGATITWTTDEASTSQVEYGRTTAYGSLTALNGALVTSHRVTLTGLAPSRLYHIRVRSRDAAGNLSTSADYTFKTPRK
jgi:hypothetical protein